MAIQSFKCRDTQAFYENGKSPVWSGIASVALRRLDMLNAAVVLADRRSPPGNRLEALSGNRAGQHGIRVNDQWRVCFIWTTIGPEAVQIIDYH